MLQLRHLTLIWMVAFIRFCDADQIADINRLVSAVDTDKNNTVTVAEVQNFYNTLAGGSGLVSRCRFATMMEGYYGGTPSYVSALYDVMQSSDGQTLSEMELRVAFLGQGVVTEVSEATFRNTLLKLNERVMNILLRPNQSPRGPTFWPYSEFDVTRLTNTVDRDNDGIISGQEITALILSVDQNGDHSIHRCEFVQGMLQYRQHAVAASNFYDILFSARDVTWAPLDSDFIMSTMDDDADGRISKAEFTRWWSERNAVAAGVGVRIEGGLVVLDDNAASRLQLSILCAMTSSVLVLLFLRD